jgi:hypothetical protein
VFTAGIAVMMLIAGLRGRREDDEEDREDRARSEGEA